VSGVGGLKDLLNLRLVCQTTKSWIDNLPMAQTSRIFSKSHVEIQAPMHKKHFHLSDFLQSPPPFGVSTLTLTGNIFSPEQTFLLGNREVWKHFYEYWINKVEHLIVSDRGHLFLAEDFITELFYTELLLKCKNLKSLTISLHNKTDYFWFQKFLKFNQKIPDLQISLSFIKEEIGERPERRYRGRIFESVDERNFCEHLGLSITNLGGKVTIKVKDLSVLPKMKAVLPEDSYQQFLNQVEFIWNFGVTSDLIDLERRLPGLKITKIDPVDCERDLDLERMTYPQGLEELTFYTTLPARHRLPESLKILNLHWFSCNSDFMSETITVLRNQCPNLETLNVQWKVVNDVVPVAQLNNNNNELLEGFQCKLL